MQLCNITPCSVFYIMVNRLRMSLVSNVPFTDLYAFNMQIGHNFPTGLILFSDSRFLIVFKLLKNLVTIFHGTICNLHGHHHFRDIDISPRMRARTCNSHLKITSRTQIACIYIRPNNTLLFTPA